METEQKRPHCTAIVLTPRVLLTTAPCALSARRTTIVAPDGTDRLEIIRTRISPSWNPAQQGGWGTSNLGLLLLASPIPGASRSFDTLHQQPLRAGQTVTLAGTGRTFRDNAATGGKLRSTTVRLDAAIAPTVSTTVSIGSAEASVDNPIGSACFGDLGGGVYVSEGQDMQLVGMIVGYTSPKGAAPDNCGGRTNIIRLSAVRPWLAEQIRTLEAWERPK